MSRLGAGCPALLVCFPSQNVSERRQGSEVLFTECALGDLTIYIIIPPTKGGIKNILHSGWDRKEKGLHDVGTWSEKAPVVLEVTPVIAGF